MLVSVYSGKGSPGVTSAALALAAVWPRPVVLVEADPTGSDLMYRCRSAAGGPLTPSPNILGLAAAARSDQAAKVGDWAQRLGCGVDVVAGVTTPNQARGMTDLWPIVGRALEASETDVIVDVGRLDHTTPTTAVTASATVRVPVVAATVESLMHTRELLKDSAGDRRAVTVPLMVGRARSASADCSDVDEVMAAAGLITEKSTHLPFDHPGLTALLNGANPSGRGRASQLVRGARGAVEHIVAGAGIEVLA